MSYVPDYKPGPRAGRPVDTVIAQPLDLKHLVYASRASAALTPDGLEDLLQRARRRNRQAGLTGLLVYHRGQFIQCLEGPRAAVDETFRRIDPDPRHHAVEMLLDQPIATRAFAAWDMACTEVGASSWLQLATAQWGFNRRVAPGTSPGFALLERVWETYRAAAEGGAPVAEG